ncbi:hypothetical protein ACLOJK_014559 [Asimina triloba]
MVDRGHSYLKRRLFGNSPFIIVMVPKFVNALLLVYKLERSPSVRFTAVEKGKKRPPKRACQLEEGSILVDSDSSTADASVLSPTGGLLAAADRVDLRGASS